MRIQHNIMAMSAYRNYTNNVSAMKKNLEKLSSGYKINRAGDDAAGLAISEKMRAQITGLETAQKNAKDGISLVQTAEGALTEVHDMLNRMVELATQSANGTYSDTTDREQLQKEVEQLKDEINRIADSSNFNGLKLLDGSMAQVEIDNIAAVAGTNVNVTSQVTFTPGGSATNITTGTAADSLVTGAASAGASSVVVGNIQLGAAGSILGTNTIAHKDVATDNKTHFSIDLHDVSFDNVKGNKLTIQVGATGANGLTIELEGKGTGALSSAALVNAIKTALGTTVTIKGQAFAVESTAVTGGDSRISFTQKNAPTNTNEVVNADMAVTISGAVITGAGYAAGTAATATGKVTMPTLAGGEVDWDSTATIGSAGAEQLVGRTFSVQLPDRTISVTLGTSAGGAAADGHLTVAATAGMTMQDVNDAICGALASIAKARTGAADGANATAVGPAFASGAEIFQATAAIFAMSANGTISATTLTGDKWTVNANGTLGTKTASQTITPVGFDYTDNSKIKLDGSFDWTATAKADTSILAGKEIKVNVAGQDFTVKLVTASAAAGADNEVVLDLGGEKPDALMNKIAANLNKQAVAYNGAKAGAATMADYTEITNFAVATDGSGGLAITATTTPMTAPTGGVTKDHFNTQTTDTKTATLDSAAKKASTTFTAVADMFADGAKISFGSASYTFRTKGTVASGEIDLTDLADANGKITASKVGEAAQRLADAASANAVWTVGASKGKLTFVEKGSAASTMTTASKVAADFKLTLASGSRTIGAADATTVTYGNKDGKSLTLQIGDTAEPFNQLKVDIRDCHANAMGITTDKEITTASGAKKTIKVVEKGNSIADINIGNQSDAAKAVDIIKAAINYVSDVRGGLGATQNRLDHTINNLSVMTENIQDAESTIRDVDVAEEMMAYTKNNILIQSAQAMLAQANQVPQGVLQLLQ